MKPTSPPSVFSALSIDSVAAACPDSDAGPSKPLPGATRFPASRPSPSAMILAPSK